MLRIHTIVGARPQFIKAAAISRAIRSHFQNRVNETLIHTGQHYDDNMSDVFFREMQIPHPAYHLGIGSGTHGAMTGRMTEAIEEVLMKDKPDVLLVYGDTNSTLAGALAAAKLHIPVAHVEAGLRSFKKSMPEEINRKLTDHISTFLFAPTTIAVENLKNEGIHHADLQSATIDNPLVIHSGDVMYDNALYYASFDSQLPESLSSKVDPDKPFVLCTIHRDFNTDDIERLKSIFTALDTLSRVEKVPVVIPLHPRTLAKLNQPEQDDVKKIINNHPYIFIVPPVSFLEMVYLLKHTQLVITDSGGLQKESYFFHRPCVILRHETEWKEIVETGKAICADVNQELIVNSARNFMQSSHTDFPSLYGDGKASVNIIQTLVNYFNA